MDAARSQSDASEARDQREGPAASEPRDVGPSGDPRIDALRGEAATAIGYTANTLRSVRERYRAAYTDELARWQALRDELDVLERKPPDLRPRLVGTDDDAGAAADAAEAGAQDEQARGLRAEVTDLGDVIGTHQTELAKL
jgi:hypothetical protein